MIKRVFENFKKKGTDPPFSNDPGPLPHMKLALLGESLMKRASGLEPTIAIARKSVRMRRKCTLVCIHRRPRPQTPLFLAHG